MKPIADATPEELYEWGKESFKLLVRDEGTTRQR
jgi:hypothetical protein